MDPIYLDDEQKIKIRQAKLSTHAVLFSPCKSAVDKTITLLQDEFDLTDEGDLKDYGSITLKWHWDDPTMMISRCLELVRRTSTSYRSEVKNSSWNQKNRSQGYARKTIHAPVSPHVPQCEGVWDLSSSYTWIIDFTWLIEALLTQSRLTMFDTSIAMYIVITLTLTYILQTSQIILHQSNM
jgi:hypothetical protein